MTRDGSTTVNGHVAEDLDIGKTADDKVVAGQPERWRFIHAGFNDTIKVQIVPTKLPESGDDTSVADLFKNKTAAETDAAEKSTAEAAKGSASVRAADASILGLGETRYFIIIPYQVTRKVYGRSEQVHPGLVSPSPNQTLARLIAGKPSLVCGTFELVQRFPKGFTRAHLDPVPEDANQILSGGLPGDLRLRSHRLDDDPRGSPPSSMSMCSE